MNTIVVINSGSSSIKYQIFGMEGEVVLAKGQIERIGTDRAIVMHETPAGRHEQERSVLDHAAGFRAMLDACASWGPTLDAVEIAGVGHRVVQGGSRFVAPVIIDDAVLAVIDDLSSLAPLHNPANLLGIKAAMAAFPDVPQVAVFDTAFHQTMPPVAYTYAIDANLASQYRIRRYGFHGTSHRYVTVQAAAFLGVPEADFNAITLHIGNGVSACAIVGGQSIDTSMGMTPLEGLVMGSRSGDIDPGILFHLHRQAGMSVDQLDELLNRRSGMVGLAGSSDLRDVQASAEREEPRAQLALEVYAHSIRHYVGAYFTEVDPLHAVVFT
ncbi:MAG TPA: acetate kinase, partial [Thermomicrobiales bacterium]|nr:acetate kinase [Thermomicrobiales bacterium]